MQELIKHLEKEYKRPIRKFGIGTWIELSYNQTLSEEFIRKYYDKVSWFWISKEQTLSEEFIEEFAYRVNWHYITNYQKLSEGFMRQFSDKIVMENLYGQNRLNWLKYRVKDGLITEEEYLKEILKSG